MFLCADFGDDAGVTHRSDGATAVSMDDEPFGKSPTQRRAAGSEDHLPGGNDQTEVRGS